MRYAPLKALDILLHDSGLSYQVNGDTITVSSKDARAEQREVGPSDANSGTANQVPTKNVQAALNEGVGGNVETVTVTGTHLRGVPPDSKPITTYSREEVEQTGSVTVAEFAATMPENFGSVSPVTQLNGFVAHTGPTLSGNSLAGETGFNIHGIGPSATLTLLDGHRLAGAGIDGQFVDVSIFPVAAIDSIQVLTDGASAVYGSDAVAGVVNVRLRTDFTGAESSAQFSTTTDGGGTEWTASQLLGAAWNTGHVMFAYQHNDQEPIFASDRSYAAPLFAPGAAQDMLIAKSKTDSIILAGSQLIAPQTTVSADFVYGNRLATDTIFVKGILELGDEYEHEISGDVAVERELGGGWVAQLDGSFSQVHEPMAIHTSIPIQARPRRYRSSTIQSCRVLWRRTPI